MKKKLSTKLVTQAQAKQLFSRVPKSYADIIDWNDDYDDPNDHLPSDRCSVCGQPMLDDIEVGQGHCITAPCWMYATGQRELVREWEERQHRQPPTLPEKDNND